MALFFWRLENAGIFPGAHFLCKETGLPGVSHCSGKMTSNRRYARRRRLMSRLRRKGYVTMLLLPQKATCESSEPPYTKPVGTVV